MTMNNKFFSEDAYKPSLWDESWAYMEEKGIIMHQSPKTVPYKYFPSILSRFPWLEDLAVIAPRSDWNSVLIPFDPLDHNEKHFNGHLISDIFTPLIKGTSSKKVFVASARPSCCFFAEFEQFDYEIFNRIAGTNEDKPFFVFDDTLRYCFGLNFDFEYAFFSSLDLQQDDERLIGSFKEWDDFFIENFVRTAPKDTFHMKLFETVLRPSIPRVLDV